MAVKGGRPPAAYGSPVDKPSLAASQCQQNCTGLLIRCGCTPSAQHAAVLASSHLKCRCCLKAHSTAWCSDKANLLTETLEKQFELVKLRTSNNGTYNQGSHAKQYGTLSIDEEPVADYLGALNTGGGIGKVLRPCLF